MKAAVLHAVGDIRYEDIETPEIGEHEALIRVRAAGICGSDIPRVMQTGTYRFPTVPGHEFTGEVAQLGKPSARIRVGDRVAVVPLVPCRACKMCIAGKFFHCENYDYLGSRSDGGFAEYARAPVDNLVPVPHEVDDLSAAVTEPACVALHTLKRAGGVSAGDRAVIFGAGPIGLLVAQWCRALGCQDLTVVDIRQKSLEIAATLGIPNRINASEVDIVKSVRNATDGVGADVVFEAAGSPISTIQAIKIARKTGRLALIGRSTTPIQLDVSLMEEIQRKELNILGVWGFEYLNLPHHDWETSLNYVKEGLIKVEPMITHRFPLSRVREVFEMIYAKKEFFCKAILIP